MQLFRVFLFSSLLFGCSVQTHAEMDTALYTHCLQWTPEAAGETFYALAIREGYPSLSPIATERNAGDAYKEGVGLFFQEQTPRTMKAAALCAHWIETGTAALGWERKQHDYCP